MIQILYYWIPINIVAHIIIEHLCWRAWVEEHEKLGVYYCHPIFENSLGLSDMPLWSLKLVFISLFTVFLIPLALIGDTKGFYSFRRGEGVERMKLERWCFWRWGLKKGGSL